MKSKIFLVLLATMVSMALVSGEQGKTVVAKRTAAKTAAPDSSLPPTTGPGGAAPRPKVGVPSRPLLDGDQAYRANCTRCHLAPPKLAERKMATVVMHMRVRANLAEREARAILAFLTK